MEKNILCSIIVLSVILSLSCTQCKTVPQSILEKKDPLSISDMAIEDKGTVGFSKGNKGPLIAQKPNSKGDPKLRVKMNADKTMELKIKIIPNIGDPATHFKYEIIKVATGEIIKKGTYRGTSIDWHDTSSLVLTPYVGMIQQSYEEDPNKVNIRTQIQTQIIKLN